MDAVSEERLQNVYPKLADATRQMSEMFVAAFPDNALRVTQGLRTWAQQKELYDTGRTVPGAIITDAPPGYSWHQFGVAIDVVPIGALGQADWNINHPQWQKLVVIAPTLGLVAGAQFRTFKDWPHFQMTGRFGVSPDDEARQILTSEGIEAFWAAAFRAETTIVT